jgi:hypothetical protein
MAQSSMSIAFNVRFGIRLDVFHKSSRSVRSTDELNGKSIIKTYLDLQVPGYWSWQAICCWMSGIDDLQFSLTTNPISALRVVQIKVFDELPKRTGVLF